MQGVLESYNDGDFGGICCFFLGKSFRCGGYLTHLRMLTRFKSLDLSTHCLICPSESSEVLERPSLLSGYLFFPVLIFIHFLA